MYGSRFNERLKEEHKIASPYIIIQEPMKTMKVYENYESLWKLWKSMKTMNAYEDYESLWKLWKSMKLLWYSKTCLQQ